MFGTAMVTVVEVSLIVFGVLVALVVLAHVHGASLVMCSRLMHVLIVPFEWLVQVAEHGLALLGAQIEIVVRDFRHRQVDNVGSWGGWTIIASLSSLVLFLGLATCDFYNTLVKLGPIIGIIVPYNPTLFSLSLGLSFVLAFLVIGWGIADVFGLSPINMHKQLSDGEKSVLRRVMLSTMILALLTTVLLMVLATEVRAGIEDTILFGAFLCFYSVLMLIATFIAGLSLFAAIASLYVVALGVIRFLTWIVGCLFYLLYRLLIALHDLAVHGLDLLAKLGAFIWNRMSPRHPIDESAQPELPTIEVLEFPHLALPMPQQVGGQKEGIVKRLPGPVSETPEDAA
jgi:hypothetical protein